MNEFLSLLRRSLEKRSSLLKAEETNAYRLFNGFYEGLPSLCADRYGDTLVLQHSARAPFESAEAAAAFYLENIPELRTVLYKDRFAPEPEKKKGVLLHGDSPAKEIVENGVRYPVDLQLNKDCGFYLDSAGLRCWLKENAAGKRVLNTFAYSGSYGIAASAGKAAAVSQTDMNRNYLKPISGIEQELIYGDFFRVVGDLKRSGRLFDLILLDPPFFSTTKGGRVDQAHNCIGLLNKLRPLAADGGEIVLINNALFLSGAELMAQLEGICGEYLQIGEIIPVPEHFFGGTLQPGRLPADPAPFNHSTKIIVLKTHRKDLRKS